MNDIEEEEKQSMDTLYVSVDVGEDDVIYLDVPSLITCFVWIYCGGNSCSLKFVKNKTSEAHARFRLPPKILEKVSANVISEDELPDAIKMCTLPAIESIGEFTVRSGLCGILRQLVLLEHHLNPHKNMFNLLGHKGKCLKSCAEVSPWTKYCEVELPSVVQPSMNALPEKLFKLENHLKLPALIYNIDKQRQTALRNAKAANPLLDDKNIDVNDLPEMQHLYAEGPDLTLTDLVIFPCVCLILNAVNKKNPNSLLEIPMILAWYDRIIGHPSIDVARDFCQLPRIDITSLDLKNCDTLSDRMLDLHLRDPNKRRYRVNQKQISEVMSKLETSNVIFCKNSFPNDEEIRLEWSAMPEAVNPTNGDLPERRRQKKCEQLENLAATVVSIAKPDDVIVDFCAGGGHVGILVAYLLPNCKVILVENKEESVRRARDRIRKLSLTNVAVYQCNMGYFVGSFTIGVCLHACGVATDLVLDACIQRRAKFVICPCCYGAIQNTHTISYPRSRDFSDAHISYEDYLVLGHAADQTEGKIVQAKQGKKCMGFIDSDRACLAQQHGYTVGLCTMQPETCSPKNNLLIGQPS